MRKLTSHIVEGDSANHQIEIDVMDEPGSGGANHSYMVQHLEPFKNLGWQLTLDFQNGPIKEAGVNGVTHEALLAIVIDRLECFQKGPLASDYNERALGFLRVAMDELHERTRQRIARGVEGTHEK